MTTLVAVPLAFEHQLPDPRVVFGPACRRRLAQEVDRLGARRVLLVGGAPPLRRVADELADDLGTRLAARITDAAQHVPAGAADAAVRTARTASVDAVVAVGGGSAIGLGKVVARDTGLPLLAVPTTYAGSEMTDIWGRTEAGRKVTGRDPRVRPRVVLYDVELTVGLPAALSAVSGLNALAHCVEAAYDTAASPITRLLAVEGARALATALPGVVADGRDRVARSGALYGAWLAGTALGTARMGVHHRLCHVLGGMGLPHAATHAVVLPHAVAFNADAARTELAPVADALGAVDGAGPALWDLARRLDAPRSLADLGLDASGARQAADELVARPGANPRPVRSDDAHRLVLAALEGQRPA